MLMTAASVKDELDDILSRWHHWASRASAARGFAPKSLVVGDYQVSRQYDDANGALDSDLESRTMKTVDFQVQQLNAFWRMAIHAEARNIVAGWECFINPRLPENRVDRRAVIDLARAALVVRLRSAGVMDRS